MASTNRLNQPAWCDRELLRSRYVGLCLTERAFHASLKHLKLKPGTPDWPEAFVLPNAVGTTHFFVTEPIRPGPYRTPRRSALVCFRDLSALKPIEVLGLFVHEATHLWQRDLADRRQDRSSVGDELEAYALQTLTQNLLAQYRNLTGRFR